MADKSDKKEKAAEVVKKSNTALDAVLSQIRKEFGELSIMKLGEHAHADIPVISTGALSLDLALGVGGLPRGRIVECYGQESSGKTTLALHVVANAQKNGGVAAFIDAEHALDPGYAKKKSAALPLYPVASKECIGCGICEKYCPAGAIKGKHMRTVPTKCISCMRCVSMCSTESRKVPAPMRLAAHLTLKKLCSERKEPKFYL